MHTAIIYTVGQTHRIYVDLTPAEAEKRWQALRDSRSDVEVALDDNKPVQRHEFQFTDEIEIWGDAGAQMRNASEMLLAMLQAGHR